MTTVTKTKAKKKQESTDITVLGPEDVAKLGRNIPKGTYIMLETTAKGDIKLEKKEVACLLAMLMGPVPSNILGEEERRAFFKVFTRADDIARGKA